MQVVVKKLTPELIETFLHFFDHVAFTDNPHWASCYCYFYKRDRDPDWDSRTAEDNRRDSVQWMQEAGLNGYLAFADGEPVGWCHANCKDNVSKGQGTPDEESAKTGVFACFVVAPEHRGKGVSTKLLQAALEGFREAGYVKVEAYPVTGDKGNSANYHGPLPMYLKNGFEIVAEQDGFCTVQKKL